MVNLVLFPVSSDLLNMFVNGIQTVFFIYFSISDVILSCPELFLHFKEAMHAGNHLLRVSRRHKYIFNRILIFNKVMMRKLGVRYFICIFYSNISTKVAKWIGNFLMVRNSSIINFKCLKLCSLSCVRPIRELMTPHVFEISYLCF